jgi:hypothetical protein
MAWVKLVGLVSQRESPEMHREFVCVFFNLADWELPPLLNGIHRKYETSKSLVDGLQFYTQEMLKVRAHTHTVKLGKKREVEVSNHHCKCHA